MNLENFLKNYAAKIIGSSMVLCCLICLRLALMGLYNYVFDKVIIDFLYPEFLILLQLVLSCLGVFIGVAVFRRKINYIKGSLLGILLFIIEICALLLLIA